MWSLTANEDASTTAHFFLGAGDEGLGTCGIGMRMEESDSELLEDEEDEVVSLGKGIWLGVRAPALEDWFPVDGDTSVLCKHRSPVVNRLYVI